MCIHITVLKDTLFYIYIYIYTFLLCILSCFFTSIKRINLYISNVLFILHTCTRWFFINALLQYYDKNIISSLREQLSEKKKGERRCVSRKIQIKDNVARIGEAAAVRRAPATDLGARKFFVEVHSRCAAKVDHRATFLTNCHAFRCRQWRCVTFNRKCFLSCPLMLDKKIRLTYPRTQVHLRKNRARPFSIFVLFFQRLSV